MESPCIDVCQIDQNTRQCEGCLRTINEISSWATLSDKQRADLMDELKVRKINAAKAQAKT